MIVDKNGAHKLAVLNPYKSVDKLLEPDFDKFFVGIKNVSSIPNTLMHKLEKDGFSLHTIDKKSTLAGRAVDTDLYNPITGHYMSGSSSGTAINVFAGINDLGIGNDGGGSVLAPAMCLNITGFISKLIEEDRNISLRPNTDGIVAGNSIGFMVRDREILKKAIKSSINIEPDYKNVMVYSDKEYLDINSKVLELKDANEDRNIFVPYLLDLLKECDVLMLTEGPVDLYGFGDSLFGHFDSRTKSIQKQAGKGYLRVCNIANATALCLPQKELGMATLLICESKKEKIAKLVGLMDKIEDIHDELIERYFLDYSSYFNEGYKI